MGYVTEIKLTAMEHATKITGTMYGLANLEAQIFGPSPKILANYYQA